MLWLAHARQATGVIADAMAPLAFFLLSNRAVPPLIAIAIRVATVHGSFSRLSKNNTQQPKCARWGIPLSLSFCSPWL